MRSRASSCYVTALDWLRDQGLTGAKEGCAEGECGACSVLVARPGRARTPTRWTALNACLVPILALDGQELVTAEGLGEPGALHPVQYEMASRGGSQCGYCTPGFICSMAAEYYRPERGAAGASRSSNGAAPARTATGGRARSRARPQRLRPARAERQPVPLHRATGRSATPPTPSVRPPPRTRWPAARTPGPGAAAPGSGSARPSSSGRPTWPRRWRCWPSGRTPCVVAGCTDWGVEVNIRGSRAPFVVAVDRLPELRTFDVGERQHRDRRRADPVRGRAAAGGRIPLLDQLWPQFASRLIRNGATIGGNLGTGSPIGDTPPALLALEAPLVLAGPGGDREVPLADYFTGYRQTVPAARRADPGGADPAAAGPRRAFHKIAKRRFDDISSVAVAFALDVTGRRRRRGARDRARRRRGHPAAGHRHRGGAGRPAVDRGDRPRGGGGAAAEGTPIDDHRASAAYRAAMLGQSLLKFHVETARQEVRA